MSKRIIIEEFERPNPDLTETVRERIEGVMDGITVRDPESKDLVSTYGLRVYRPGNKEPIEFTLLYTPSAKTAIYVSGDARHGGKIAVKANSAAESVFIFLSEHMGAMSAGDRKDEKATPQDAAQMDLVEEARKSKGPGIYLALVDGTAGSEGTPRLVAPADLKTTTEPYTLVEIRPLGEFCGAREGDECPGCGRQTEFASAGGAKRDKETAWCSVLRVQLERFAPRKKKNQAEKPPSQFRRDPLCLKYEVVVVEEEPPAMKPPHDFPAVDMSSGTICWKIEAGSPVEGKLAIMDVNGEPGWEFQYPGPGNGTFCVGPVTQAELFVSEADARAFLDQMKPEETVESDSSVTDSEEDKVE